MGLLGGSSMSTSSVVNSLDFSPVFNMGDGNTSKMDKTVDQTATVRPRLDEGITASVGVGVGGGSGSGGTVSKMGQEEQLDNESMLLPNSSNNKAIILAVAAVLGVGAAAYFFTQKKGRRK